MDRKKELKTIVQREHMSSGSRCPACGRNFNMGEPAVMAIGDWKGGAPRLVHEEDAVFDETVDFYVVKRI